MEYFLKKAELSELVCVLELKSSGDLPAAECRRAERLFSRPYGSG